MIWFALKPNTTLIPGLIFTFITFNTKYYFTGGSIRLNVYYISVSLPLSLAPGIILQ